VPTTGDGKTALCGIEQAYNQEQRPFLYHLYPIRKRFCQSLVAEPLITAFKTCSFRSDLKFPHKFVKEAPDQKNFEHFAWNLKRWLRREQNRSEFTMLLFIVFKTLYFYGTLGYFKNFKQFDCLLYSK
jgi:hypothetical protein